MPTIKVNANGEAALETREVRVHYGESEAIKKITMEIPRNRVVALIGPSGCGKSTLLRCFNRMNDLVPDARVTGEVLFHGENLYADQVDPVESPGPGNSLFPARRTSCPTGSDPTALRSFACFMQGDVGPMRSELSP